jgi:ubiquinone biosynthesis accessory factor UbiK
MIQAKQINDFVQNVVNALPSGLKNLPVETRAHIKSCVMSTLKDMELVTREEFDVQQAMLARTREKLEALEAQVKAAQAPKTR